MRYVAAYLLASLSGTPPSKAEVKKILSSVGVETDDTKLNAFFSSMDGKDANKLISEGLSKLASVPSAGAAAPASSGKPAAAPAAGGAAPAGKKEAPKEEKPESDEDIGFGLFD